MAAEKSDDEGAKAFAAYFFDVVNYVTATRDVTPLEAISSDICKACSQTIRDAENAESAGKSTTGAQFSLRAAEVIKSVGNKRIVEVTMSRTAGQTTNGSGLVTSSTTPVPFIAYDLGLERMENGWHILGLSVVSS